MPSLVKVKVHRAVDLPVMDRVSRLADAYVDLHFGRFDTQHTTVARKTLHPVWNQEFDWRVAQDEELFAEPLVLQVCVQ